jgi:hypothetical protein
MFKFYQNMVGTLKIFLHRNDKRIFFTNRNAKKKFCREPELRSVPFQALLITTTGRLFLFIPVFIKYYYHLFSLYLLSCIVHCFLSDLLYLIELLCLKGFFSVYKY